MAGASGSGGAAVANDALSNIHALMCAGWGFDGTDAVDWTGTKRLEADYDIVDLTDTYAARPSALRFLFEDGLTHTGGNPFEGASAFAPEEALSDTNDRYKIFDDLVQALSPEDDWESYVTAALAQDDNVVPELDVDAIFTAIINKAISHASIVVSTASNDARIETQLALDEAKNRASAEADAATGIFSGAAISEADGVLQEVRTDVEDDSAVTDSLATARTDSTAISTDLSSHGLTNGEVVGDGVASSAKVDADNELNAAVTEAIDLSADIAESEADAKSAVQSISGDAIGNAQSGVDLLEANAEGLSGSLLDLIDDKIMDSGGLAEVASDNIHTDAIADSVTGIASMGNTALPVAKEVMNDMDALAAVVANTEVTSAQSNAVSLAASLIAGADSNAQADASIMLAAGIEDGENAAMAQMPNADASAQAIAGSATETAITKAEDSATSLESSTRTSAKAAMLDILGDIDPDIAGDIMAAVLNARTAASQVISDAIMSSADAIDNDKVRAAVTNFRKRALTTHLRGINRFAGGMADINAVNGSAFIIGMALMEGEFTNKVSDFQANLEIELYRSALPLFVQAFQNTLTASMSLRAEQFRNYIDVYKSSLTVSAQAYTTVLPNYINIYVTGMAEYMKIFVDITSKYNDASIQGKGLESQVAQGLTALEVGTYDSLQGKGVQSAGQFSELQSRLIGSIGDLRQRMVGDLSRLQMEAFVQSLNARVGSTGRLETIQAEVLKGGVGDVTKLASQLVEGHTNLFAQSANSRTQSAQGFAQMELGALQSDLTQRVNNLQALTEQELNTYRVLLASKMQAYQQNASQEMEGFFKILQQTVGVMLSSMNSHMGSTMQSRVSEAGNRQAFVRESVQALAGAVQNHIALEGDSSRLLGELNRVGIVAKSEEYEKNLEYDVKSANWDLELFQQVGNVMSAVNGSVVSDAGKPSRGGSALGGAISGASMGAAVGTAVAPGPGTALAAGIGAAIGLIGGASAGYQQ